MSIVIIDPSCFDPAIIVNGVNLNAVNLNLANAVKNRLLERIQANDISMTRTTNTICPTLQERIDFINAQPDAEIAINVGVNSFEGRPELRGYEYFYTSPSGQTLVQNLFDETTGVLNAWDILNPSPRGGLINTDEFRFLNDTNPVAALIRPGYATNDLDASALFNTNFQQQYGIALANGILVSMGIDIEQPPPEDNGNGDDVVVPPPDEVKRAGIDPLLLGGVALAGLGLAFLLTRRRGG